MYKRTFAAGIAVLLAVIFLSVLYLTLSSSPVAASRPPRAPFPAAANAEPPPGCIAINTDIAVPTEWISPCYHVATTTVSVLTGAALTVYPGVAVYFAPASRLRVAENATLNAVGMSNAPITFTSAATFSQPCDWEGILVDSESGPGLHIAHATVEYACAGLNVAGRRYLTVANNVFRYNGKGDGSGGAVLGDTDYSVITGNTIYSCENGFHLNEAGGNKIAANHIYSITGAGLWFDAGGMGGGKDNTIHANVIHHCGADGVRLEDGEGNEVLSNTIHHVMTNSADDGAAIYLLEQKKAVARGNHLYANGPDDGDNGYRAAVYVTGTHDLKNVITGNTIHDIVTDVVLYANSAITPDVAYNALCAQAAGAYELRNTTTIEAEAGRNYWSTNTPPTGSISGPANFTPWITLSIPTIDVYGSVTVTLRGRNGVTFFTVPRTPTALPVSSTIPNARKITLTSNWGYFDPQAVLLDDDGLATARWMISPTVDPVTAPIVVTATDFCGTPITTTLAMPDLAITKTTLTTPAQAIVGGLIAYRIDYANHGDAAAPTVLITDTLPLGVQWVTDTAAAVGWTRTQTTPHVIWTRPGLEAGAHGSFLVTTTIATTDACGLQVTNRVTITSAALEKRLDDNTDQAEPVTVLCPAIVITKTGPALSKATDVHTYIYEIANAGVPSSASPLALVRISDRGVGWSGLGDLTAHGCITLATGARCTFQVSHTVALTAPDPLVNIVTATYRLPIFDQFVTDTASHTVNPAWLTNLR